MNAATEFDTGPLSWIKSEIDLALERADQALQDYTTLPHESAAGDPTHLKFCQTHLHQVCGALNIISLDGVTQFTEAAETLLGRIQQQAPAVQIVHVALVRRALNAIGRFLDELLSGQANQPLRLLPLYREVQTACGVEHVSASDLFFPDLTARLPHRNFLPKTLTSAELLPYLRSERARFQRGFLMWLKAPQDRRGVLDMLEAIRHIEEIQESSSARTFWWVTTGFFTALADGTMPKEADVKPLCTRIDLQIRRLLEGSKSVAERLVRDVLYFVSCAESQDPLVLLIKSTYHLSAILPESALTLHAPEQALSRKLRDIIAATEGAWNRFCSGSGQALPVFGENASLLSSLVDLLGQADFCRLARTILATANWLLEGKNRVSEALAMEVATAILLAQNAQQNLPRLGGDFTREVDVSVTRIRACLAGSAALPATATALLDGMSRQAQEKLMIGQVAKEMTSNLGHIEQVLDEFFRDADKRKKLETLEKPLYQVIGVLTMLHQESAVIALRECAAAIKTFSEIEYQPQDADFVRVADQLSMLGFFIDSLEQGESDFSDFAQKMQLGGESFPTTSEAPIPTIEQEVRQQKHDTSALLSELRAEPENKELQEAVKLNLGELKKDASLLADAALSGLTQSLLGALNLGEDYSHLLDAAEEEFATDYLEIPSPSHKTLQLAQANSEEIDAELLSIFLEEAYEVVQTIDEHLKRLKEQPRNIDSLTVLRRAFHTLKGSGRMVGLTTLGEAAWAVEQTLNSWLRQERAVDAPLLTLLEKAHLLFVHWVAYLEDSSSGQAPDSAEVDALAESLRNHAGEDEIITAALVQALAPLAPESTLKEEAPESQQEALSNISEIPEALPVDAVLSPAADAGFAISDESSLPRGNEISSTLRDIFFAEAQEYLTTLRSELALLQAEPLIATPFAMYRAAHTLAGISSTVGMLSLSQLGQALEHALLRRDHSARSDDPVALEIIRQVIDEIAQLLTTSAEPHEPDSVPQWIAALNALYPEILSAPEPVTLPELDDSADEVTQPQDLALAQQIPTLLEDVVETISDILPDATSTVLIDDETEIEAEALPDEFSEAEDADELADEIDEQLLPIFLEEALDLTQGISAQLRAWRQAPDEDTAVRVLTRLLHTLKGSARMAGAVRLGEKAHALETRVGQAYGQVDPALIDEIDHAFDAILEDIEGLQALGEPEASSLAPKMYEGAEREEKEVETEIDSPVARATLRVRADLIDRLVNETGELSISRTRIEGEMRSLKASLLDLTENVIRLRHQLRDIEIQAELQMQSHTALIDEPHAEFDPLELDRFTQFQELTRMMAESVNDVASVQQNLLKNLDDANAALVAQAALNRVVQQELMAVRMLPFDSLAERLYRIVRQTAKELNKRANLEIKGGRLELDRNVLATIAAPLEHLLRNAVVHGIEAPERRRELGKAEIGEIVLSLKQEDNEIVLTLADDGAGFDSARIRARALEAGLLVEEDVLDATRLTELVFTPGFSTASEVSQVAGRGVGTDVVKTEVASLGGRVETISQPGQGTEFQLYLPLTLALTKALIVRVGSKKYAVPSVMIEQVLDLKEAALAAIRDAGTADWMEHSYPFHFLPHLLGETKALPEQRRQYWVLLVRSGTRRVAVQVDELLGNEEIVVKNIGPQLARVVGIDGATVLGDGQLVLILNPLALSRRERLTEAVIPIPSANTEPKAVSTILPTVMIVDDSLTVRKITSRLLAREGYQVLTAKDGVDALEQTLDVVPNVMLVDIEMPRMDGFELTQNIRSDARLKHVPIIMITSRTAEKHRTYASELGVNHYLGKPFQEEELLQLIAGFVAQQKRAAKLTSDSA